jgi:hypothetical protein
MSITLNSHRMVHQTITRFSIVFILLGFGMLGNSVTLHAQSLARETLGGVSVDTSLPDVIEKFGKADSTSKELYDERSQCWVKVYFYDQEGIEIEVCRVGRNYNIRSVRSVNSEIARTSKDKGVGSTSSSIIRSYTNAKVIGYHTIIVEDKVRGIILRFLLENKKVYEVNLYKDETITARTRLKKSNSGYRSLRR